MQPVDLLLRHPLRQLRRRHPRAVQDLVGVGVADAGEEARVRQRALDRVVLARQRLAEAGRGPRRAPRSPRGRAPRAPASPATRWSEARFFVDASESTSEPSGKSNAASAPRPPTFAPRFLQCSRPATIRCRTRKRSPSSDEDDPLADAAQRDDLAAFGLRERRRHRPQQKRARQPHRLETLADDARLERGQVAEDVGQLRHGSKLTIRANSDPYGDR